MGPPDFSVVALKTSRGRERSISKRGVAFGVASVASQLNVRVWGVFWGNESCAHLLQI